MWGVDWVGMGWTSEHTSSLKSNQDAPEGSVQLKREELGVDASQLEKKDFAAVAQFN